MIKRLTDASTYLLAFARILLQTIQVLLNASVLDAVVYIKIVEKLVGFLIYTRHLVVKRDQLDCLLMLLMQLLLLLWRLVFKTRLIKLDYTLELRLFQRCQLFPFAQIFFDNAIQARICES